MILYLDASGVVKLLLSEEGSGVADSAWSAADLTVTSRITVPECRAALAAAARSGRLTAHAHQMAKGNLLTRLVDLDFVEVTEETAEDAGELAERRSLRGSDAVHLASASLLGSVHFLTWDMRLRDAAHAEGHAVIPAMS